MASFHTSERAHSSVYRVDNSETGEKTERVTRSFEVTWITLIWLRKISNKKVYLESRNGSEIKFDSSEEASLFCLVYS